MKKIIVLVLIVILFGSSYYFYTKNKINAEDQILTLYGNVDIRDVALGFRVAGRVAEMRFEEGDHVNKGDIVAVLEKKPFLDELALTQAELDETKATVANALRVFKRRVELVKTGAVSQNQYDEALANRDTARARQVRAEARLNLIKTKLADAEIHAPSNGIILTRVREPGSIVAVGANIYSLALNHPVWVRTYIDEPHLGHVYPGQKAKILLDSGAVYEGQIGFISPQAEFTPKNVETTQLRTNLVYRLRIIANNPEQGLRQGMPVTIKININTKNHKDEK